MHNSIIITLPVADVGRSRKFFAALGYAFDERMSGAKALCVRLGDSLSAMLLERGFYESLLLGKKVLDPATTSGCVVCLGVDAREDVDVLVDKAIAAGATAGDTSENGGTYDRSFFDLDGHAWQIIWGGPA